MSLYLTYVKVCTMSEYDSKLKKYDKKLVGYF